MEPEKFFGVLIMAGWRTERETDAEEGSISRVGFRSSFEISTDASVSAPVLTPIDIWESNPITFCLISWRNPIITDMDTIITITDKVIPMIAIRIPVDPLFRDDLSDKRCAKNNESDISPIESMRSLYFI